MNVHDEMISTADFGRLPRPTYEKAGINLSLEKKTMIELRVNVATTNKTDFFQEAVRFDMLVQKAFPNLLGCYGNGEPLLVWSAGCSSGEEPYTLAMVLCEYKMAHPGFRFRVLATDISTTVLAKAERGVYSRDVVRLVPDLQQKYLMRSCDFESKMVRVAPELHASVQFRRVNFMDADCGLPEKAEIFFCRSVLIYFERPPQEQILKKLLRHVAGSGYRVRGPCRSIVRHESPVGALGASLVQER